MLAQLHTGVQKVGDGAMPIARGGNLGDRMVSDLHPRFYEQNLRGKVFTFGISETAFVAANAIATGVDATAIPVIGLWNPSFNPVNLVILQANVVIGQIQNTAVALGGLMWMYSAGNSLISTGSIPFLLRNFQSTGVSNAKAFAMSTLLTGLTNNLAVLRAAAITPILNAAGEATAKHRFQGSCCDAADGSLFVPPGGVLAIMNQVSTTTLSASVSIIWEEVPIP